MITKNQWDEFIHNLYLTRLCFKEVFVSGQRLDIVDLNNKEFVTILQGYPPSRFKHKDSITDGMKLEELYASVTIRNVSLNELKRFKLL